MWSPKSILSNVIIKSHFKILNTMVHSRTQHCESSHNSCNILMWGLLSIFIVNLKTVVILLLYSLQKLLPILEIILAVFLLFTSLLLIISQKCWSFGKIIIQLCFIFSQLLKMDTLFANKNKKLHYHKTIIY